MDQTEPMGQTVVPSPVRRVGPPVPGETDAERYERERNNREEYIAGIAIGGQA